MTTNNLFSITQRVQLPTPPFFKKLRTIGLVLATVGGSILATPDGLPVIVVQVAGYITLAGGIISTISQMTVDTPASSPANEAS